MSSKDEQFMNEINRRGFTIEYQAYNFVINKEITTDFKMKLATMEQYELINKIFTELPKLLVQPVAV